MAETRAKAKKAAKKGPVQQAQVETVIDASGLVLGRMCTNAAKRLLAGERVHIVNSERAIVTGPNKDAIKHRYLWKAAVGTRRKGPFFDRQPHLIVRRTVRGMISYQTPSGRAAFKRLRCWIGVPRELQGRAAVPVPEAQRPQPIYLTVGEISKYIGGRWREVAVKEAA